MENSTQSKKTNYSIEKNPAVITEEDKAEIKKQIHKKKLHLAELVIRAALPPTCPPKGNFFTIVLLKSQGASTDEFEKNREIPDPQNSYLSFYVQETCNNRDAQRSSQFFEKIFKFNYSQEGITFFDFMDKHYPEFVTRLMKKSIRYMINNEPWEMVELRLRSNLKMLCLAVEDYFFNKKLDVVHRLVELYSLVPATAETATSGKACLQKKEICEWVLQGMPEKPEQLVDNFLLRDDKFGPWTTQEQSLKEDGIQPDWKSRFNDSLPTGNPLMNLSDYGVVETDVLIISTLKDLQNSIKDIKVMPYIALDFEFVPATIIGQIHHLSLLQIAGYDPEKEAASQIKIWVVDLINPRQRYLADSSYTGINDELEYVQLIQIVLDDIIGNVSCTKLGLGLVNDLQNLKTACDYPAEKKLVRLFFNRLALEKLSLSRKHVQKCLS